MGPRKRLSLLVGVLSAADPQILPKKFKFKPIKVRILHHNIETDRLSLQRLQAGISAKRDRGCEVHQAWCGLQGTKQ